MQNFSRIMRFNFIFYGERKKKLMLPVIIYEFDPNESRLYYGINIVHGWKAVVSTELREQTAECKQHALTDTYTKQSLNEHIAVGKLIFHLLFSLLLPLRLLFIHFFCYHYVSLMELITSPDTVENEMKRLFSYC